MATSFKAELQQCISNSLAAFADRKLTPHEVLGVIKDVCQLAETIINGIGDDDVKFNDLVLDCEELADEYIVKRDIPWINNFVERFFVDPATVSMVRPLLEQLRDGVAPRI